MQTELYYQKAFIQELITDQEILDLYEIEYRNFTQPKQDWRIVELEFSNVLCYDKNIHRIDFRNTVGIFGSNGAGKTMIIDMIQFLLFGRTNRFGTEFTMRDGGYCKLVLTYNDLTYVFRADWVDGQVKQTIPADLFEADLFNLMHSVQHGFYCNSTKKFMQMNVPEQQSVLNLLLESDPLILCLQRLTKHPDVYFRRKLEILYDHIRCADTIEKYLLPKIVRITSSIIKTVLDFDIVCFEVDQRIMFEEYLPKKNIQCEFSGTKFGVFNMALAQCFHTMFYRMQTGFFIADEFINYPIGENLDLALKLMKSAKTRYNCVLLMSVHEAGIKSVCDEIYEIESGSVRKC